MGVVHSALVYTYRDIAGNLRTEGWFTYEFRENYTGGGVVVDLSPFFRRVEQVLVNPMSGARDYLPKVNDADFPGHPGSGRIMLWEIPQATVPISGIGISVTSGQNVHIASGNLTGILMSGRIAADATLPPRSFGEVLSGTPVSGTRVRIFAMGY